MVSIKFGEQSQFREIKICIFTKLNHNNKNSPHLFHRISQPAWEFLLSRGQCVFMLSLSLISQECLNTGHNLISRPPPRDVQRSFTILCVTDVYFRKTNGLVKNKKMTGLRNPQIISIIVFLESPTTFWPSDRKSYWTVYFYMNFEIHKSCP